MKIMDKCGRTSKVKEANTDKILRKIDTIVAGNGL